MNGLTFKSLRTVNLIRCNSWHPNNGVYDWSLSDWAVELGEEVGEALGKVKRLNRIRIGAKNLTSDPEKLREELADELADVVIVADLVAAHQGIDLAQAVVEKFNKTSDRFGFAEKLDNK